MLTISRLKKFYFVPDVNDMRCGAHRLLEIVRHKHHLNTSNGDVYIFMSKNQRTVKLMNFEENAYYVHQKTFANGYTFMKLRFVEEKPIYSIYWKDLLADTGGMRGDLMQKYQLFTTLFLRRVRCVAYQRWNILMNSSRQRLSENSLI